MERIGKYEILGKIGEGGFGVVYHGWDPFIKRPVALKTCTSTSEDVRRRFFREAEIAGNLHHPNIVTIHDFGLDGDLPYLVQELLSGEDLAARIAAGNGLSVHSRLRILAQVAEALDYAHRRGVIHRDVKPANIRLLEGNRVKVMDFGIARLEDQETRLTRTGTTLGTVAYLSPEQLRGRAIDHRADIFSFGVVAYELLSGHRPFEAPTLPQLFYALVHQSPQPLEGRAPDCPSSMARLVERCLEKSPDDRYTSFSELLPELRSGLSAAGGTSRSEQVVDGTLSLPPAMASSSMRAGTLDATAAVPSLDRLAVQIEQALEDGDLHTAARLFDTARRAHGESLVRARLDTQAEALARLQGKRDARIRQATALLIGDHESSRTTNEAPFAEPPEGTDHGAVGLTEDLVEQEWHRIEALLGMQRVEEAGIHISRLRPLLGNHPTFRRLEQRFRVARRSKLGTRRAAPRTTPPGAPDGPTDPSSEAPLSKERAAVVRKAVESAEEELRRGRLDAAEARVRAADSALGGDPALDALAARIVHVRTLTALEGLVSRGQKAVTARDYELGQRLALEALKIDAGYLDARALFRRAESGLRRVRHGAERRRP